MVKLHFDSKKHKYTLDGRDVPSVTEVLDGAGLTNLSHVRHDVLKAAAKFGKAVHHACEWYDTGELNIEKLDSDLVPYLNGWIKFRKDYCVKIYEIEKKVYSIRRQFAGTLDRILEAGRTLTLIDIKSSTTVMPSTAIQLAGYKIAREEMLIPKIKQRWCIHLIPGGYRVHEYKDKRDETIFLSALNVYNYRKEYGLWKTK